MHRIQIPTVYNKWKAFLWFHFGGKARCYNKWNYIINIILNTTTNGRVIDANPTPTKTKWKKYGTNYEVIPTTESNICGGHKNIGQSISHVAYQKSISHVPFFLFFIFMG